MVNFENLKGFENRQILHSRPLCNVPFGGLFFLWYRKDPKAAAAVILSKQPFY